jgi:TRAP-type C4-dicarboxylate transport system substrate-binding protein
MAARVFTRKLGPIGIALTTWDLWRRLPPEYRRQIMAVAAKHGPRVAAIAAQRYRQYKKRVS